MLLGSLIEINLYDNMFLEVMYIKDTSSLTLKEEISFVFISL